MDWFFRLQEKDRAEQAIDDIKAKEKEDRDEAWKELRGQLVRYMKSGKHEEAVDTILNLVKGPLGLEDDSEEGIEEGLDE